MGFGAPERERKNERESLRKQKSEKKSGGGRKETGEGEMEREWTIRRAVHSGERFLGRLLECAEAVVLADKAIRPTAVLSAPVVFASRALRPTAVLFEAVVFAAKTL